MGIIRTFIWMVLLVALAVFSAVNWDPMVTVRIWPGLLLDTKIPMIVAASFLIGFVPLWLYHRGVKWQMGRRIQSLERSLPVPVPPASATASEADFPETQVPPA